MNQVGQFSTFLIENAESLSREIVEFNIEKLEIELPVEVIERSIETNRDFFDFLGRWLEAPIEIVTENF